MRWGTVVIVIGVLALAAIGAGCGDDESSADAPTKAEFIEQGDAACQEANDEGQKALVAFLKKYDQKPGKAQQEEAVETIIVPLVDAQIEALDELDPPDGDEDQVDAIVASLEDVRTEAEENPADTATTYAPFTKSKKLATEYGFENCGANN